MSITALDNNALDQIAIRRDRPFVLFGDLSATSTKEWLVRELLGDGDASTVYGKPGDGKSVLVEDMALHIAAGRDWHGKRVKQGAVLYIALERKKLVERRAIAFRDTYDPSNLPFAIMGGVHDFRDPRTAERVVQIGREVAEATETPLRLICIDTLSRALCGGDENASKDMGAIVNATALLQQGTGAHICWLHHMPAEAERMRGHGSLLGAMDTTILVTKSGNVRTATVVKANDSEEGAQIAFTLESVTVGTDADGNPTTAPIVRQAEASPALAAEGPKLTKNQQTMFSLLQGAGASGLTTERWYEMARNEGLGVKRKADLCDIRTALKSKGIVRQYGDRWNVA
jgi:hypothetical protein